MTATWETLPPLDLPDDPAPAPAPARLRPLPGPGLLARSGELVLLCEHGPGRDEPVGALLDALSAGTVRDLGRRVGGLLAATEDFPAFCAFGPAGDGIGVLLHGHAELTAVLADGPVRLDGRDALSLVDRMLPGPVRSVRALLGDERLDVPADRWGHIDSGVVTAGGLEYEPSSAPAPEVEQSGPCPSCAESASAAAAAARSAATAAAAAAGRLPEPPPLPEPPALAVLPPDPALAVGVPCKDGHLNDPHTPYCSQCGISMTQSARAPSVAGRGPLGVVVLDDGTALPLDRDCVLGTAPESDEAVRAGTAAAVVLRDDMVAAVHARLVLEDWEVAVVDAGSPNGTFLCEPGQGSWVLLPSGQPVRLRPGARIGLGLRQLTFHSYRNP